MKASFSAEARAQALQRFERETFDVLVVGGGITGAAVARECCSQGLSVALIEKRDFSFGTSSRSSKLIHGGLRYLENFEFKLVFEALSERALLLKTVPHLVRPLPFYFPVYRGDRNGRAILSLGLWLYDLLALFRAPGYHRSLSKKRLLRELPELRGEGLRGGFRYFDASMWDDVLGIELLRDAARRGVAAVNYVEATRPIWEGDRITGFAFQDLEGSRQGVVRARRVILCAGPWTDEVGARLTAERGANPETKEGRGSSGANPSWKKWLAPSKGVHLLFDLKRLPLPGAMVMSQPEDGRIAFVIPRPDFGAGVLLVGTTDGPSPEDPERAEISKQDVDYLLGLLNRYFPRVGFSVDDILSATIGVRPLVVPPQSSGELKDSRSLQKVSREHHIDLGPGGTVIAAGGKYTTHRTMAEEIVAFAIEKDADLAKKRNRLFSTTLPPNPEATPEALSRAQALPRASEVQAELWSRYGAEALEILAIDEELKAKRGLGSSAARSASSSTALADPEGFPRLEAQLRFNIRQGMVLHLEDFYFRRIPLFFARSDHGLPWLEPLASAWAEELGRSDSEKSAEKRRLCDEILRREQWRGVHR